MGYVTVRYGILGYKPLCLNDTRRPLETQADAAPLPSASTSGRRVAPEAHPRPPHCWQHKEALPWTTAYFARLEARPSIIASEAHIKAVS